MKVHNYTEWNEYNKSEITLESPKTDTAIDMVVPKSFPGLCTPYVQVVHQPWKCTVHNLGNACTDGVSKKCPSLAQNSLYPRVCPRVCYIIVISGK